MTNDFKVLLIGSEVNDGCGFYRIHQPMRVAVDEGYNVEYDDGMDSEAIIDPDGSITINKLDYRDADLVVFQRPSSYAIHESIKWLQARGVACAVEMDDDLGAVHKDNSAYYAVHPKYSPHENWEWFAKNAGLADLVIGSTPALIRRYAKHGRGVVLRNRIPKYYLESSLAKIDLDNLRVGWSGTLRNHPEDLHVVGGHVEAALQGRGFHVVGDGVGVKEALGVSGEVHASGWVPLDEYIGYMWNHMDIGIVPLKIDAFNQAKSYLKGLEMASQGIPCIVSDTEEYNRFSIATGNPVAKRGKDWQKHLKKLLNDVDFLEERRYTVREIVRTATYENHIGLWVDSWKLAIENRHHRK